MINKQIKNTNNPVAIIFGASIGGKNAYNFYKHKYKIRAFVDNNKNLQGKQFYGHNVFQAKGYNFEEADIVIIASSRSYEIYDHLIESGLSDSRIEFVYSEVLQGRYELDKDFVLFVIAALFILILTPSFLIMSLLMAIGALF